MLTPTSFRPPTQPFNSSAHSHSPGMLLSADNFTGSNVAAAAPFRYA